MSPDRKFPTLGYQYIAAVAVCGAVALAASGRSLWLEPPQSGWLVLAALTWVSSAFAIKIPSISATISVSEVFVFAVAVLFGGPAAAVTVGLDGLFSSIYRGNRQPRHLIFNVCEPALSAAVACYLYHLAGGPAALSTDAALLNSLVVPMLVLATSYLLMNTWLTAGVMAFESGASVITIWRGHILWLSVNFLGGASIALLLAVNMREVNMQGLVLILPLVFILYLAFRTWTERVREASSHVAAIDRLYLSTVEAFATAIESKDEVTHGHVRRVQTLSLAIASHLGVADPTQLKAIESGALLHDIGKVAIPDHLLNKPGKLIPAEYELMKLHAPIGSEILKAVDFPYPVVPIVRHHHENWDGTGYPDRLVGEAIPLGARILSVVDCFDALTSDRPYRRALGDEEAIEVIAARRGSMYDPAVVDALMGCYRTFRSTMPAVETSQVSLLIARANQQPEAAEQPASVRPTPPPAGHLDRSRPASQAGRRSGAADNAVIPMTAAMLREMTPATTVCVSLVNGARQCVEVVHVAGHGEQLLRDGSVPLGEGITGWVAAHRAAIVNSDPALDFPRQLSALVPRLVAALAVPVGSTGVLTLYTDQPSGFGLADRVIAEQAAQRLEAAMLASAGSEPPAAVLPPRSPLDLEPAMAALLLSALPAGRNFGVLNIAIPADHADSQADEAMLAALVLPAIRLSDGLLATSRNEIVAVLPGCEPEAESLIRSRLQGILDETSDPVSALAVGFAVAPHDGLTLAEALRTARERQHVLFRSTAARRREELVPVAARERR